MSKKEAKENYVHYVSPVRVVPEWHKLYNFVLVENIEQLKDICSNLPENYHMSFDTETSSLDPEMGHIVGYSFCFDGKIAYYVPVNHYIDTFNMYDEALDIIYDVMCNASRVVMYNARFDMRFMEYHGYNKVGYKYRFSFVKYDMSKTKWYDVSNAGWLSDTNIKLPSLKDTALRFLGYKMQTYAEVSDGVENFYYIDPKDCFFYAGSDALCTYLLVGPTMKYNVEAGYIAKVDNYFLYPLMRCENEKILLDAEMLVRLEAACHIRIEELERQIYNEVGHVFKLNSPMQVSNAFFGLGIDTGGRTATGYMKTGIDELEALPEHVKNQHPALARFVDYKTSFKFLSSYVRVLNNIAKENKYVRCGYKTLQVPTGRLASGKDSKNTFFSEINIQSMPKPHPAYYYALDMEDRNLFSRKDNIIMGYKFVPVQYDADGNIVDGKTIHSNYICLIEGMEQKQNVRSALLPHENEESGENDWVWCSIDFAGQEIRIATNLSREPVWVEAFKNGEDIHRQTAYAIWGKENYDKDKRKMAKGANFAVIYGAEAMSFVGGGRTKERPEGMSLIEAEEFFANYKKGLPGLFSYQERLVRSCKQRGIVTTFFGRPRRVKYFFANRQTGFGKRTVLNSPIQGSAGDVLKIVMCKLWKEVLNHTDYKDDAIFKITVHDEINYGVRANRLNEITKKLEQTMTFTIAEWEVPLTVDVSFGWNWGNLVTFKWDDEKQNYVPKSE